MSHVGLESHSTWEESSLKCPPVSHVSHNNLKTTSLQKNLSDVSVRQTSTELRGPGCRVPLSGNQRFNDMMTIVSVTRLFLKDDVMQCGLRQRRYSIHI